MNNMQKVMDAIQRAGRPIADVEIALMTGMDPLTVQRALDNAKAAGYLTKIPATYKVTARGEASVELIRQGRQRLPGRPVRRHGIVQQAIRTQPNSVFQLGAMA